jgi:hypothetical protein
MIAKALKSNVYQETTVPGFSRARFGGASVSGIENEIDTSRTITVD